MCGVALLVFFFFKQKTAYEMRISDWSSDVCSSDLSDYERWVAMTEPGAGSAFFRMNGAGENLTWSAADFENFLEPRPDLARTMERDLEKIVELLATNEWPFRIHATYDESIDRFLTVFERVNQEQPFKTGSEEQTTQ